MRNSIFVAAFVLVASLSAFAQPKSFKSVNYPTKYIRHQAFQAKLSDVVTDLDKKDASFKEVAGLDGKGMSYESVNFPGFYLRHNNFVLLLEKNDGSSEFKKDATFLRKEGLAGAGISFESINYPDFFLRHNAFVLKLQKNDNSDIFKKDASFTEAGELGFSDAAEAKAEAEAQAARYEAAEESASIIGKPFKLGGFEVAQNDFGTQMEWDQANEACNSLGRGWRLPTEEELNKIYVSLAKKKRGGFSSTIYWSSSLHRDALYNSVLGAKFQDFKISGWGQRDWNAKRNPHSVRAVRTL